MPKTKRVLIILLGLIVFIIALVMLYKNVTRKTPQMTKEAAESEVSEAINPDQAKDAGEDVKKEEKPFVFRDVFGEEYEMNINPDVPAVTYSKDAFLHDGDKVSYTDGKYSLGIDVSHHQGEIDWDKVKAAGYDFAILRIGYRGYGQTGSLNRDEKFEENYKNAKAAGLSVGAYFFAQAINEQEAKEEADFVLEILDERPLDLPVVYDPESILDDEARTDNVSGQQFTKNTRVFCERIEESGYRPMIYANMLWEAFELDLSELLDYPIWYADYESVPQSPYAFEIWQYTNEGQVPGVEGPCDINIWID